MKRWWKKVKEFYSRPKVIRWTIVILTLVIIGGTIKALLWSIYTEDKPSFVPEEVREEIQGAIKESGEAIKKVSEPIGTAIVNSVYEDSGEDEEDSTAGWQTYSDEDLGITFEYPKDWQVFESGMESFSFGPNLDSLDGITVYYSDSFNGIEEYWADYIKEWDAVIIGPEILTFGENIFYKYVQQDGMREIHYLFERNGTVYDLMPNGAGNDYVTKMLANIK